VIHVHFKGRAHYFFKTESAVSAAAHFYSFVKHFFDFFVLFVGAFQLLWLILTPLATSPCLRIPFLKHFIPAFELNLDELGTIE
jgi:hypothetical protein